MILDNLIVSLDLKSINLHFPSDKKKIDLRPHIKARFERWAKHKLRYYAADKVSGMWRVYDKLF